MSIDPGTLPDDAIVELERGAWHGPKSHLDPTDENVTRVFVPVPDGVAYEDALRAVEDARPWVPLPDGLREGEQYGKRVRAVSRQNRDVLVAGVVHMVTNDARVYLRDLALTMPSRDWDWFIHPDDVPDPDADLIEAIRERWVSEMSHSDILTPSATLIRLALSMARERGAL